MWKVFNMGCGFVCTVPEADADAAVELLSKRHPGAARIGRVTSDAGRVSLPGIGIAGDGDGLRAVG